MPSAAVRWILRRTRDAAKALEARARIRERVQREGWESDIELFDREAFHSNISIAENLLFGLPRHPAFQPANLAGNREIIELLRDVGLLDEFYAAGAKVAGLMVELFADVPADSPMFDQYSLISAEALPDFRLLVAKIDSEGMSNLSDEERASLLALTFRIVVAQHRLGLMGAEEGAAMKANIVKARAEFRRRYANRADVIEFFEPDRFSPALSIQDNILFGRVAFDKANALDRAKTVFREVAAEVGMEPELLRLGLGYEVGNAGSRLSYSQRQRLAIARGIMKNPDVVIFNEPTSGLDPATELRVLRAVLGWAKGRTVVWALARADLAREFDRVIVLGDGRIVDEGTFAELEHKEGGTLATMLAAH
jgi:ABC-type phosphate/phosphonate transport system ATPase subunit